MSFKYDNSCISKYIKIVLKGGIKYSGQILEINKEQSYFLIKDRQGIVRVLWSEIMADTPLMSEGEFNDK